MVAFSNVEDESIDAEESLPLGSLWTNVYLRRVGLSAGLGSLLFGLDTGVVSSMLVALARAADSLDSGPLTEGQEEIVVSATTIGRSPNCSKACRLT